MKVSDETLMLFHDGELDAEQARTVRVRRLHHPQVTARLEAFSLVGDAVRHWAREAGVDAAHERREAARTRARRRALSVGAAIVLASLAVPFVLAARGRAGADDARVDSALSTRGEPPERPDPVAVETVDFGARPGAIFEVERDAERETTVVWLEDANADLPDKNTL